MKLAQRRFGAIALLVALSGLAAIGCLGWILGSASAATVPVTITAPPASEAEAEEGEEEAQEEGEEEDGEGESEAETGSSAVHRRARPRISLSSAKATVAGSAISIQLHCSRAACRGTLKLKSAHQAIGSTSFRLRKASSATVTMHVSGRFAKRLAQARRHPLAATALIALVKGKETSSRIQIV